MAQVSDNSYHLWKHYIKKFCDECVEAEETQKRQIQLMFELRWNLMGEDGRKRYVCYCHGTLHGLYPDNIISPESQENFDRVLSTCLVCGSLKKRQLMPLPGVEARNRRPIFMGSLITEHHLDPDTFRWNVAMSPLAMFCPAHLTKRMHEELGLSVRKQQQKAAYEAQAGPSNQSREQPQRQSAGSAPQQPVPTQPRPQQPQPPIVDGPSNLATTLRALSAVTPAPPSPVNTPVTSAPNIMNPHLMSMRAMNQMPTQMAAQMQLMGQPHSSHMFGMPHPAFAQFPMGVHPGMVPVRGLIPGQHEMPSAHGMPSVHGIPLSYKQITTQPISSTKFMAPNLLPQEGQHPQQDNPLRQQPQGARPTTSGYRCGEQISSGEMQSRGNLQSVPSRKPENRVRPLDYPQPQPPPVARVFCELCKMEVKTTADQMFHKMIHQTKSKYFCLECNTPVFGNEEQDLVRHMLRHTNNTWRFELSCPFPACLQKNLDRSISLKKHIVTVHANQLPHLALCGMKLATQEASQKHDNEHERNPENRCCNLCLTINCWTKEEIGIPKYSHELIHGIIRILRCQICGEEMKGPNQKYALLQHWINKHTARSPNARSPMCTSCKKSISREESEAHLKEHMAFMFSASTRGPNNAPSLIVKTCNNMARLLGIQNTNSDPNQMFYEDV